MARTRKGHAVREERKENADARQQLRDELTPAQQLARLDERLGVDVGAKRERARLQKLIGAEKGGDSQE